MINTFTRKEVSTLVDLFCRSSAYKTNAIILGEIKDIYIHRCDHFKDGEVEALEKFGYKTGAVDNNFGGFFTFVKKDQS
jgi:hypothetical protein